MTNHYGNVIFKQKRLGKNQKILLFLNSKYETNTKNKPSLYKEKGNKNWF